MLPNPLHPAIVHFPVVLVFLLPIFALGAVWAIRRGAAPARAWAIPLAMAAALTLSAWVAVRTGQAQEERVENVTSESAIHTHEEAAELFLMLSGLLLLVSGAGLIRGGLGRTARIASTVGAAGLIIVGLRVGHTGGELVYRHGAAAAYTQPPIVDAGAPASHATEDGDE